MGSVDVYLVFLFGGAVFASFVPVAKFLFLAPVLTLIYFGYDLVAFASLGESVIAAVAVFIFVQLGYVAGLVLRIAYVNFFPKHILISDLNDAMKEKTKTK